MEYNQTLSQDLVTGNIMSRHRFSRARRAGFTIVELTIVLVVIGLLLSGILKGQELINGAKIRAIVDRQSSLNIAWDQFVDRYGAKPGDYAGTDIPYATLSPTGGNSVVELGESALAMEHLALAQMIKNCPQCIGGARDGVIPPSAENSLTNQYGGVISIWHNGPLDSVTGAPYYAIRRSDDSRPRPNRLQIHTGPRIPSNILAEVDRKIDDGLANSGRMVFNQYDPTDSTGANGGRPDRRVCMNATTDPNDPSRNAPGELDAPGIMYYRLAHQSVEGNCGAGIFI